MSRPKSARAAKAPKPAKAPKAAKASRPAARPTGRPGVFVQKPRSDVYVALLGISLAAILIGCLLLLTVLKGYNFELKAAALSSPEPSNFAIV